MPTADPALFSFAIMGNEVHVTLWTLFGLIMGNALFTSRVLVQWILSERHGRSVTPKSFWWLSLVATVAMIAYGFHRMEVPFILGYAVNLMPYTRNLILSYRPSRGAGPWGIALCFAAVLGCLAMLATHRADAVKDAWFFFGLAGSLVFNSRFLVQWVHSERLGRSELSLPFWYLSLVGSVTLLIYSLKRTDPVFTLGFLFNAIPYIRNIMLLRRANALAQAAGESVGGVALKSEE